MTRITAIAAVARNGVIGADGDMPWHIPEDSRRFRRVTMGHPLVMGRKTFDSHGLLPGRTTVVVTRDRRWRADGVRVAPTVDEALSLARQIDPNAVFVTGGGDVYRAAWDRLTHLDITEVDASPDGDVTFPVIDPRQWHETGRESHDGFAFVSYLRR